MNKKVKNPVNNYAQVLIFLNESSVEKDSSIDNDTSMEDDQTRTKKKGGDKRIRKKPPPPPPPTELVDECKGLKQNLNTHSKNLMIL
tara:strand:- start:283 stop:543 length:261 start_codon:yes stop_codon:yes gene_type:complete